MAAIMLVSVCAAGLGKTSASSTVQGLMGSVFANGSVLGYVVVGLLGMVLGAVVTLVFVRWGRPQTTKGSEPPSLPNPTDDGDASW